MRRRPRWRLAGDDPLALWLAAVLAAALLLAGSGCASAPTQPPIVRVAVPVSCIGRDDIPRQPRVTPDEELAAMDDFELILRIASERSEWIAYGKEAGAALKECSK